MKRKILCPPMLFLVGLAFLTFVQAGRAQVQNASLTGLITDPTGAVIADAMVAAKNVATNIEYSQKTDASGYYLFPSLPIGTYSLSVEAAGFKKALHGGVVLQVGERGREDVKLEIGGITELVEVTA